MKANITEIKTVVRYEIKMSLRQPIWWMLGLFMFGICWISVDRADLPYISAMKLTNVPGIALAVWGSLLLPIAAVTGTIRELPEGHEWYWMHLRKETSSIFAKFLTMLILSCLTIGPAYLYVSCLLVANYGLSSLWEQATFWSMYILPSFGTSLAVTLLLSLLTRSRIWGLVASLSVVGGFVFSDLDNTHLFALAPVKILASTITGLEPTSRLLYLNRLFWFMSMAILLAICVYLILRMQPRVPELPGRTQRLGFPALLIIGILLTLTVGVSFNKEHRQTLFWGGMHAQAPWHDTPCPGLDTYQVDLTIRPDSRVVRGIAQIQVSSTPTTISYHLRSGLTWELSADQQANQVIIDSKEDTITFHSSEDASNLFRLAYRGIPRQPMEFISCKSCLNDLEFSIYPYIYGWYLDRETVFLTSQGDWHPFPQCPIDQLTITLDALSCENSACAIQNSDTISQAGGLRMVWDTIPNGPLLASSPNLPVHEVNDVLIYYPKTLFPEQERNGIMQVYSAALQAMKQHGLLDDGAVLKAAVAPMLRYSQYAESGILFIPERYILIPALISRENVDSFAAKQVVSAWWSHGSVCPDLQPENGLFLNSTATRRCSGEIENRVVQTLINYTSLRLLTPETEITLLTNTDLTAQITSIDIGLRKQLDRLYLEAPGDYWELIRQYRERYGTENISLEDFEQFVLDVAGRPLPTLPEAQSSS